MSLEGKTIILFGAGVLASGYAPLFAEQKTNIVMVAVDDTAEQLAKSIEGTAKSVLAIKTDVTVPENIESVYAQTHEKYDAVDVVVNGAGGNMPTATAKTVDAFCNMDPKAIVEVWKRNYLSRRYSMQVFAKYLIEHGKEGRVVNITSMSGIDPLSMVHDYSAAFAAVENFVKSAAFFYACQGIGAVNNVAVGFTLSEQNRSLLIDEKTGEPTPRGSEILGATGEHRYVTKEEVGREVVRLSDKALSSGINGATIRVDAAYGNVGLPQTAGYATKQK